MRYNEKTAMSKLLKTYVEDLKNGKKPKVLKIFKENPDLAKQMAPLIHIARLSMIKENSINDRSLSSKKAKKISDNLTKKFRGLNKSESDKKASFQKMKPAIAFRKNKAQKSNEEKDYTSEAIEKMIEEMDKDNE